MLRVGVKSPLSLKIAVASLLCFAAVYGLSVITGKMLFINYSPSVPLGLYVRSFSKGINKGDFVVFRLPEVVVREIKGRSWYREEYDYIKEVAAVSGDRVCVEGQRLLINDVMVGEVLDNDYLGSPLPHFLSGCVVLKENELIVLGLNSERSFDGRYFGVLGRNAIISKVNRLLTFNNCC